MFKGSINYLQITGEVDAVRKALQSVSQQLLENHSRDQDSSAIATGPSSHSYGQPLPRLDGPPPNRSFIGQGACYADGPHDVADYHSSGSLMMTKFHEGGIPGRMKHSQDILTFRLLCHEERVGSVIGKGGQIIKTLQMDTGCEIKVMEGVSDSEDRVITVSGPAV